MNYYVYMIACKSKTKYCLWHESDVGDRFVSEAGKIRTFSTLEQVKEYGELNNFDVCKDITTLNISGDIDTTDVKSVLEVWNVASDISNTLYSSIWINSKTKKINRIYVKLLWGCNLEPLTPENEEFVPNFNDKQQKLIRRIYKFAQKYIRTKLLF